MPIEANKRALEKAKQEELLKSALAGNARDLDILIETVRPLVVSVLRSEARTPQDAEDLVQQVLIAAAANLGKYRRESGFSNWVLGIAGNILRNYYGRVLNRLDRQQCLEDFLEFDAAQVKQIASDMSPINRAAYQQYASRLVEIVQSECSGIEYTVLVMTLDHESTADIALLLGISEGLVRQHLLRGREKVLEHIVLHEEEMMGGRAAIELAWRKVLDATDPRHFPTQQEQEAWNNPKGRAKEFRKACVKMAKYLQV